MSDSELETYAKASLAIAQGYLKAEKIMKLKNEYYTANSYREQANERIAEAKRYRAEDKG